MFGRVKLDNTLLIFDQGNFNQITARSQSQILITVVRDTSDTSVSPAPLAINQAISLVQQPRKYQEVSRPSWGNERHYKEL